MQKLKIGFDSQREEDYNNKLELKTRMAKEAIEYAKEFVVVDSIENFLKGFTECFNDLFMQQTANDFSKRIIIDKRKEMVGYYTSKMQAYESQFNSIDIELNADLKPTQKQDFNIYLEGAERIKKYKTKLRFLEALQEYKESGGVYQSAMLQRSFPSQFLYSFAENKLTPTLN